MFINQVCYRSSITTGKGPRNYKCTFDPELDTQGLKTSNQPIYEYEGENVKIHFITVFYGKNLIQNLLNNVFFSRHLPP